MIYKYTQSIKILAILKKSLLSRIVFHRPVEFYVALFLLWNFLPKYYNLVTPRLCTLPHKEGQREKERGRKRERERKKGREEGRKESSKGISVSKSHSEITEIMETIKSIIQSTWPQAGLLHWAVWETAFTWYPVVSSNLQFSFPKFQLPSVNYSLKILNGEFQK